MSDNKSPSGKYELKGDAVIRVSDQKVLKDVPLYHQYNTWIVKDDQEWICLRLGKDWSQLFFNCDTLEEKKDIDPCLDPMYWTDTWSSPDGNTVAAYGCFWGGPYFVNFYDITDLSKGWPMLCQTSEVFDEKKLYWLEADECVWIDSQTVKLFLFDKNKHTHTLGVYKREGDEMHLLEYHPTDPHFHAELSGW